MLVGVNLARGASDESCPIQMFNVSEEVFNECLHVRRALVVLSVLLILAGLFAPARASATGRGRDVMCLNNVRQLIRAWQLYSSDNQERFVMVFHGGDAQGGVAGMDPSKAPWTVGWLDWTTSHDNTNVLYLTEDRYSRLARYLGRSKDVFKCPSDQYVSPQQRRLGWTGRIRSYSANLAVGEGNAESGPWESIYRHVRKSSDLVNPGPSQTYVYVDEHADSINDPGAVQSASERLGRPARVLP